MKDTKENYVSAYNIEDLIKTGGEIPDEIYNEDESPDELGYEEMTLEELEAAYMESVADDEISAMPKSVRDDISDDDDEHPVRSKSDNEIIDRLNKIPMARDIYFREQKKHLDEGFMKRNIGVLSNDICELNKTDDWFEKMEILKDAMDMAARQLMTNPDTKQLRLKIAERDGESPEQIRKIRKLGMINVERLLSSLEQVSDIIKDSVDAPKDLVYDIQDTNRILVELCQRVLEDYNNYEIEDIEKIISWMNRNNKYPTYLGLFKQVYFDFVIKFTNELLKHKQDVGDVFIRALNFMIKTNSRVLNVIIKEKSEDFAPVARYVRDLKKNNRL